MNKKYFLGIDTSNYTTSLALVDEQANLIACKQQMLTVEAGERGLRQSEALFFHVKNLPNLIEELCAELPILQNDLTAIAATTKPRPTADSYMPVFLPGEGLGRSLASILQIPYYTLSHQENHVWAGLKSGKGPISPRFLVLQISGGTSEMLHVELEENYSFSTRILGGTQDLHAGQFVDRVGVALDLNFPAGPELEKLAGQSTKTLVIPSYHKEGKISFAGPETAARRFIGSEHPADISKAVLLNISRTIIKLIDWAVGKTGLNQVLVVGGVAANLIIRQMLLERLPKLELFFAEPAFSRDNSLGAALYCGLSYCGQEFYGNVFK